MNPERLPSPGVGETPGTKNVVRVAFPAKLIARARKLGAPEHASVAQIARRALQKELDPIVTNCALHQSELTMEAAATNVTLHFSIHLSAAGKSPQLPLVCSQ